MSPRTFSRLHSLFVGCDTVEPLEENIAIAADFEPLTGEQMAHPERLTKAYALDAAFFRRGGAGWGRTGVDGHRAG